MVFSFVELIFNEILKTEVVKKQTKTILILRPSTLGGVLS